MLQIQHRVSRSIGGLRAPAGCNALRRTTLVADWVSSSPSRGIGHDHAVTVIRATFGGAEHRLVSRRISQMTGWVSCLQTLSRGAAAGKPPQIVLEIELLGGELLQTRCSRSWRLGSMDSPHGGPTRLHRIRQEHVFGWWLSPALESVYLPRLVKTSSHCGTKPACRDRAPCAPESQLGLRQRRLQRSN